MLYNRIIIKDYEKFCEFFQKNFTKPHPFPPPHIPFIHMYQSPQIEFFTTLPSPCDVAKKSAQNPVLYPVLKPAYFVIDLHKT